MVFIFIAFFLLAVIAALYGIFLPLIKEQKVSCGIRNQDVFSKNYLFKLNCSKQEFINQIILYNINDTMEYSFNSNTMTITFIQNSVHIPYFVSIKELEDGCYIKLTKERTIFDRSIIPYRINEFMIKKFCAEVLPYEKYKSIV